MTLINLARLLLPTGCATLKRHAQRAVCAVCAALFPLTALAADRVDYARQVKPILQARCYACHGALKQESNLRLDTAAAIRRGGDGGQAIASGKADASLLIERISAKDLENRMPPEGEPLTAAQIELFKRWINQGATAPDDEQPEADPNRHWAFQRPQRPAWPGTDSSTDTDRVTGIEPHQDSNSSRNPIDLFIDNRLKRHALTPGPRAPKQVLLRRVYLDLTGLPPTRDQLLAFLADDSPDAYERVVARLLNSTQHGERWARHWMDVWRYSDWYGRRHVPDVWNSAPQVWRWRDWIVRSLNQDKGYDRMVREMLAADEICPDEPENAVATGYLIRNWYALNPNDWMRNTVEHTGKAFLALTFNCAHCHNHKYDPITHDDYFRMRAFFEPLYVRQDRVRGEADPGPFQDYNYSTLRKIQPLGAVRVFDKTPDAPTWFYTGGDERNRMKQRGSIAPGVPAFLATALANIEPVELPPRAFYPGLDPGIQQTVLAEARQQIAAAQSARDAARSSGDGASESARAQLAKAEAAYQSALAEAKSAGRLDAVSGQQSLVFNAVRGRRILQNRLPGLKQFGDGFSIEFQLALKTDTHFNFQLAKDVTKGLTAGYVAFDKGRIVSYRPGTFSEFEAGRYKFGGGQNHFHVHLALQTGRDQCLLTIRSLRDDVLLTESVPIALNGWNPLGDPTKAISFDARTGCVAAVDDLILRTSGVDDPIAHFNFEPPAYPPGRDVIGLGSWEASSFSVAPATSILAASLNDQKLAARRQQLETARRVARLGQLQLQAADARVAAARANLTSVVARIAADRAKYGETSGETPGKTSGADAAALAGEAAHLEKELARRRLEADELTHLHQLAVAESKPATDPKRAKAIEAAHKQLLATRNALTKTRSAAATAATAAKTYTGFSPVYPKTSTGRRTALAQWITSPDNPLTARVAVNHIWLRHFHSPLVNSVYDFGRNGTPPTHPQLLDWLAMELVQSGWSMKHLHRLIVTSEAYKRATSIGESTGESTGTSIGDSKPGSLKGLQIDPENQLLWRMNTGRMEAEVVRDSLLYAGGMLDLRAGGRPLENKHALSTYRRSLYYEVYPEDGGASPLSALFDAPSPLDCYRRTRSIVPQQALALTNSQLMHMVSRKIVEQWEQRFKASTVPSHSRFVEEMFQAILSRSPTNAERDLCTAAIARQVTLHGSAAKTSPQSAARQSLVRALLNHNDFVTVR